MLLPETNLVSCFPVLFLIFCNEIIIFKPSAKQAFKMNRVLLLLPSNSTVKSIKTKQNREYLRGKGFPCHTALEILPENHRCAPYELVKKCQCTV